MMKRFIHRMRQSVVLTSMLCFFMVFPSHLWAESPVKMKNFLGTIDLSAMPGPVPFTLEGEASHLGQFTSQGEVTFTPGEEPGTLVGTGVVVFRAANGDLLVGNVTWNVSAESNDTRTTSIHFGWQDSVTFSDGTVAVNTGRFVTDRPPGLVVIAIIAVLIALLVPAVQKVR
jgi:hypothetical protein